MTSHRTTRWVGRLVLVSVLLLLAGVRVQAFEVFHSPADDGVAGDMPAAVPLGAGVIVLHLYLRADSPGAASQGGAACSGAPADGDEICAWDVTLETADGIEMTAFSPAAGVVHLLDADGVLRANGIHAAAPAAGPRKLGDLAVRASALPGSLGVATGTVVDAALLRRSLPASVIATSTAADTDGDGIHDLDDNCIEIPNPAQRDTDGDGYGNRCDGDFNGDGAVNFLDLGIMKSRFFTADPDTDLNGDGAVNFLDLGILRSLFFEPPGPSGVVP